MTIGEALVRIDRGVDDGAHAAGVGELAADEVARGGGEIVAGARFVEQVAAIGNQSRRLPEAVLKRQQSVPDRAMDGNCRCPVTDRLGTNRVCDVLTGEPYSLPAEANIQGLGQYRQGVGVVRRDTVASTGQRGQAV